MIGMTVCSGIGAAELSAPWIDWRYQSEIEPFPCAVLRERFPGAVNLGDMTRFQEWPDAIVDVLAGGTPCQSFSVAGLRKGLTDPRGNLMLTFLAIARRYRPRWVVWENVPGVLSSNGGRDFGAFLRGLGECGYGWSCRVLDAQYVRTSGFPRAVPQRRRRVFVVGYLGDWRPPAAVLFEPEGLQGHPAPRREAGQGVAARAASGVAIRGRDGGGTAELTGDVATALRASRGGGDKPHALVAPTIPSRSTGGGGLGTDFDCDGGLIAHDVAPTLNAHFGDKMGLENQHINGGCGHFVAHALRGEGFDASEDGTGRGTPLVPVVTDTLVSNGNAHSGFRDEKGLVPVAIQERAVSENPDAGPDGAGYRQDGASYTLEARTVPQAVAFAENSRAEVRLQGGDGQVSPQLTTGGGKPGQGQPCIATPWAVRRLTPKEAERLMGYPDDWTRIPYRNKPADACPDGPRYKALGNSWAINCGQFVFDRINAVEGIIQEA